MTTCWIRPGRYEQEYDSDGYSRTRKRVVPFKGVVDETERALNERTLELGCDIHWCNSTAVDIEDKEGPNYMCVNDFFQVITAFGGDRP